MNRQKCCTAGTLMQTDRAHHTILTAFWVLAVHQQWHSEWVPLALFPGIFYGPTMAQHHRCCMETTLTSAQVIDLLNLQPLEPEGGMFCSTYRSKLALNGRHFSSAIYYLLEAPAFSHLHRLDADELYHFYIGAPVELLQLAPDGTAKRIVLGQDLLAGQRPQALVPAGYWQGAHLLGGGQWALLGTTMCPAFHKTAYEHGCGSTLAAQYPQQQDLISLLTQNG